MKLSEIEIGSLWMYDNSSAVFQVICVTDIKSIGCGVVTKNTDSGLYFHTLIDMFPEGRKQVQPAQAMYRQMTAKHDEGVKL